MPVLVTSKFDEDPIKNERPSLKTPLSNYKSMGNFSDAQRAPNCKKQQRKGGDIVFPIISQWALSVAMETRVLIQSVPKPYTAFPPP